MPWGQLGTNIVGEGYRDNPGNSISLSGNGQTIIVGASFNDGNGFNVGHARVYGWSSYNSNWYQIGQDIDSEQTSSSGNGYSVAISRDGLVIAVSDTLNDGSGSDAGSVRVYTLNSALNEWEQRGIDIDGEAVNDQSGFAVSLNNNGTILAISSINNGPYSNGHVRVYNWNGGSWQQLGSDIDGIYDWGQSGGSVSLSSDGYTVAIGGISINNGSGAVAIYKYESSVWTSKIIIFGEAASNYFGCSVSLSADASIVAVGGYGNNSMTGRTRIFQLNYINNSYTQRGSDINGENVNDYSGLSVSLNLDGTIVAVGTRGYNNNVGNVKIYKWNQSTWELIETLYGTNPGDQFGYPVSLSSNGYVVAATAYVDADGYVKVFKSDTLTTFGGGTPTPYNFNNNMRTSRITVTANYGNVFTIKSDDVLSLVGVTRQQDSNYYFKESQKLYYMYGGNTYHLLMKHYRGSPSWGGINSVNNYYSLLPDTNTNLKSARFLPYGITADEATNQNWNVSWENNTSSNPVSYSSVGIVQGQMIDIYYTNNPVVIKVTVVNNKYYIQEGSSTTVQSPNIEFIAGFTYIFDQSHVSNTGQQIVFGMYPDSSTIYTTGVSVYSIPGAGLGAYTVLDIPSNYNYTQKLYYYSNSSPNMGYFPPLETPTFNFSIVPNTTTVGSSITLATPPSTSTGEFQYSSSNINVASVSGNVLSIKRAGAVIIYATQLATSTFSSRTINSVLTVAQGTPNFSFSIVPNTTTVGSTITITNPTSNSTGEFQYSSSDINVASVSGNVVSIIGVGTVTISATQLAITNYYTSRTIDSVLTVAQGTPNFSFSIVPNTTTVGSSITITNPTSTSTGAFQYSSSDMNVASVAGNVVSIIGVGTVSISATQLATTNYTSRTIDSVLTVAQGTPNFSFSIVPNTTTVGSSITIINPTSNSTGAFQYSSSDINVASVAGNVVSIIGVGTVSISATQLATTNYTSRTIDSVLTVAQGTPNFSFSIVPNTTTVGSSITIINPTSNSTGAFQYSSSDMNVASVAGNVVSILQIGTVTISATQLATTNYTSRTIDSVLTVAQGTPNFSFSIVPNTTTVGSSITIINPTSNSTGAFQYSSSDMNVASVAGNVVSILQIGTVTISATQLATTNYTSRTIQTVLRVIEPESEMTYNVQSSAVRTNIMNSVLTGRSVMPMKNETSVNENSFSMSRIILSKTINTHTKLSNDENVKKLKQFYGARNSDASMVTSKLRALTQGTKNEVGTQVSFQGTKTTNDEKQALRRVRSGGAVVPIKKIAK